MKPDKPTRRDKLEQQITALVLGELSPKEADRIRQQINSKPELAAFHQQMERTIGLVQEASLPLPVEDQPADTEEHRLSNERRQALLNQFKSPNPPPSLPPQPITPQKQPRVPTRIFKLSWLAPVAAAASILVLLSLHFASNVSQRRPVAMTQLTSEAKASLSEAARPDIDGVDGPARYYGAQNKKAAAKNPGVDHKLWMDYSTDLDGDGATQLPQGVVPPSSGPVYSAKAVGDVAVDSPIDDFFFDSSRSGDYQPPPTAPAATPPTPGAGRIFLPAVSDESTVSFDVTPNPPALVAGTALSAPVRAQVEDGDTPFARTADQNDRLESLRRPAAATAPNSALWDHEAPPNASGPEPARAAQVPTWNIATTTADANIARHESFGIVSVNGGIDQSLGGARQADAIAQPNNQTVDPLNGSVFFSGVANGVVRTSPTDGYAVSGSVVHLNDDEFLGESAAQHSPPTQPRFGSRGLTPQQPDAAETEALSSTTRGGRISGVTAGFGFGGGGGGGFAGSGELGEARSQSATPATPNAPGDTAKPEGWSFKSDSAIAGEPPPTSLSSVTVNTEFAELTGERSDPASDSGVFLDIRLSESLSQLSAAPQARDFRTVARESEPSQPNVWEERLELENSENRTGVAGQKTQQKAEGLAFNKAKKMSQAASALSADDRVSRETILQAGEEELGQAQVGQLEEFRQYQEESKEKSNTLLNFGRPANPSVSSPPPPTASPSLGLPTITSRSSRRSARQATPNAPKVERVDQLQSELAKRPSRPEISQVEIPQTAMKYSGSVEPNSIGADVSRRRLARGNRTVGSELRGVIEALPPPIQPEAEFDDLVRNLAESDQKLSRLNADLGELNQRLSDLQPATGTVLEDQVKEIADQESIVTANTVELQTDATKKRQLEVAAKPLDTAPPAPAKTAPAPATKPEVATKANPFSTFSLNVTDVAFKLAAASLANNTLPDRATLRSEEFLNAFNYHDPAPLPGKPLAFAWEQAHNPFEHNRDLIRFSIQTAASGRQQNQPLNLVLLLDNSGSMEREDRVQIVRVALDVLARQLTPIDRISVVSFARTPRLWINALQGGQPDELTRRVGNLNPEGGTNLELALNLAYETAQNQFMPQGNNRVILLTDGAANLGNVNPDALKQKVESHRKKGIALDCFGIGWEGYNDDLLEVLSRNGDGRYGFINDPQAAARDFAGQLAGALRVAASNVKAQVEFNPQRVTRHRQIGYEKHQLTREQFRDNTVDAAEIGAAEAGTALYSIQVNPNGAGPIGTVRVRYKVPATGRYQEEEWLLPYNPAVPALDQAYPSMRLAAVASTLAEFLAANPYAANVTLPALQNILQGVPETFPNDERPRQLAAMLQQARSITGQ